MVILVDAENALNKLNQMVALHNIRYLCPALSIVLINTYRSSSRLFITGGGEISSEEGTTQGDTLAMAFYGISTLPILQQLKSRVPDIKQVWFADDATGAGALQALKVWWEEVINEGKRYGYHVKPAKSWLILKDQAKTAEARELFSDCPINITSDGKRHLGAALGSHQYKEDYMSEKVDEWCREMKVLSEIAKSQPHAAYAAYTHGEQHKFTYFMRTLSNVSHILEPLDDIIDNKFIPALFGHDLSEEERKIVALPIKDGGLGLRRISISADSAYKASTTITTPLIKAIVKQSSELPDTNDVRKARNEGVTAVEAKKSSIRDETINSLPAEKRRSIDETSAPGASSWLAALPLKNQGFNLNKGEFQDALCLRYDKTPKNLPSKCPCGAPFTTTHAMNCHRGGFVNARHDNVRNFDANLLETVCNDVELEPHLQKVTGGSYSRSTNISDEARLDIRARGFWRSAQNAFFDIRITNSNCNSQKEKPLNTILRKHELEKKRNYNTRIIEVEQGTFTPIVITTKGMMGPESETFHKALANKISTKKGERYEDVLRFIRIKLSLLGLKSQLLCLRGSRSKCQANLVQCGDYKYTLNELSI